MFDIVYAMGQGGGGAGGGGFQAFIPLILMFVIFYFLLIRPQQKKNKEHKLMLSQLNKGDKIQTSGGLQGTITGLDENVLTVEIAEKVRVKIARTSVAGVVGGNRNPQQPPKDAQKGPEKKEKKSILSAFKK